MAAISIFKDVPRVPMDHVFQVNKSYVEDKDPRKVNMGIGGKFSSKSAGGDDISRGPDL